MNTWKDIEDLIDAYLASYTMEGDSSSYTPSESERCVIKDAIVGLLADPVFIDAISGN